MFRSRCTLLSFALLLCLAATPVRAFAPVPVQSAAAEMMYTMWELMEWFFERRPPGYGAPWRYGDPAASWYAPHLQTIDGVWLSPAGEYWLVEGERFLFVTAAGVRYEGWLRREGRFIRVALPYGEREFDYRLRGDTLMLRDVTGQVTSLRRVRHPQWNW